MALRTIVEQQQALISEYHSLMDSIDGIPRFVDIDRITRTKEIGIERLVYANRRDDKEVNNLYYRTVLVMWKQTAQDLVYGIEKSPRLKFYRIFFLDRICGCGSIHYLVKELNNNIQQIVDPTISRTMTLEETKAAYKDIVNRSCSFLISISDRKGRIAAGVSALCSIFGVSVAYVIIKLLAIIKSGIIFLRT
jgi:hypothetical protein